MPNKRGDRTGKALDREALVLSKGGKKAEGLEGTKAERQGSFHMDSLCREISEATQGLYKLETLAQAGHWLP
jgi:hypothetical protein